MARIGFFVPAVPGHLNASLTLAHGLTKLGHEIVFVTLVDGQKKILSCGFRAQTIGESHFTQETVREAYAKLATLSGLTAVRFTLELLRRKYQVTLDELPPQLASLDVDGWVVDEIEAAAALLLLQREIPFVSLSNALLLNREAAVPPVFSHLPLAEGWWGRFQVARQYQLAHWTFRPAISVLRQHQRQHGGPAITDGRELTSPLAKLVQIPKSFDFPRLNLPSNVHYVGPLHGTQTRAAVDFPWNLLDGRPLIYASLGTLQNRLWYVFEWIAKACQDLPVQLVVSLGDDAEPGERPRLPGDPITVRFAPQLELLRRASLCITHAGLNTTMESVARGVPLLAIPITNDQPAVAARIRHHGLGTRLKLAELSVTSIRNALRTLLNDTGYAERTQRMAAEIQLLGGAAAAARLVEQSLCSAATIGLAKLI